MRNSSASRTLAGCLTTEEMRPFLARSNWRAAWVTTFNLSVGGALKIKKEARRQAASVR